MPTFCNDTSGLDWRYGFDVRPDTIEVWNIAYWLQPPLPSGNSNDDSERYWECWLQRGAHVGATGGSDTHWCRYRCAARPRQSDDVGVRARPQQAGVLEAIRAGRTSISLLPPLLGGPRLVLEADRDGNGTYESMIGDTVPPGTRMRVTATRLPSVGFVEVRANGHTIVNGALLLPGKAVTFTSPARYRMGARHAASSRPAEPAHRGV